jgi:RNA polymerase sigma-70 factor (ECF subfamily)
MSDLRSSNAVIAFKNGHTTSLPALRDEYYPALCRFADGLLGDPSAADDIVAEIFVLLSKKRQDFETLQTINAFLYLSTRNACLNYLRKAERDSLLKTGLRRYLDSDQEGFVLNEVIREEVLQQIQAAVELLPYHCRQVFKMCYLEGLSNTEVAERFRLSVHTVKNHKVRAIGLLRLKFPAHSSLS